MPYVHPDIREHLRPVAVRSARTAGELNYQLTLLALDYIEENGLSYETINHVGGAFNDASKEFYRRVAVPYEDEKIAQNGDVYPRL